MRVGGGEKGRERRKGERDRAGKRWMDIRRERESEREL